MHIDYLVLRLEGYGFRSITNQPRAFQIAGQVIANWNIGSLAWLTIQPYTAHLVFSTGNGRKFYVPVLISSTFYLFFYLFFLFYR